MSSEHIPHYLQRRVRERAANRCEYCLLPQAGQEATFHVDHIRPRREGGPTVAENLALACVSCSLRKGARTSATDPETREPTELFHPRQHRWMDHFELDDRYCINGKTPTGRATVAALRLNRALGVTLRWEESLRGRYP
jgi:hypothetical protein